MPSTRSKSLIFDLYGAYIRPAGGWIAIADLVTLMGDLGVDGQTVRSAVSRMSSGGVLVRRKLNGQVGYELSGPTDSLLAEGDLKIFRATEPADAAEGWAVVLFSIPEKDRHERHRLRSQLTWLGFGAIGGGVWIAPRRALEHSIELLTREGFADYVDVFAAEFVGLGEVESLVARAWDLPRLALMYEDIVQSAEPMLRRWRRRREGREREAFIDYTMMLHQWRKMPYLDPGLPEQLLPPEWKRTRATELFNEAVERLEKRATGYFESVVQGVA